MSHKQSKTPKPAYTERVGVPSASRNKEGNAILLCPFCVPTHPLQMNSVGACGTALQIRAVQLVYKAKYNKGMVCVKCGQGGGEMVIFQGAYVHTHDCTPGVVAMTEEPKYSPFAYMVSKIKNAKLKSMIEKYTGEAKPVEQVDPSGKRTGVVLGWFFYKKG